MDNSTAANITANDERSVAGTFAIAEIANAGAPFFNSSDLVGYAENLLRSSSVLSSDEAVLVDMSAHFINLEYCAQINATAQLIDQRPTFSSWEVKLTDQDDRDMARITLSYLCTQEAVRAAKEAPKASKTQNTRKQKKVGKRDAIAKAACDVIADKGFAAATMREIAVAAKMHVPTMYQYVRSKEEVLELVYHTEISRVRLNVKAALNNDLPPMEKLLGIVSSLVRNNGEMRKAAGVLNRELRSLSHQARSRVLADYAELMDEISQVVVEGTATGEMRNAQAELVVNMIDAMCDLWALRPFALAGVKEDVFLNELLEFVQKGLRKD